MKELKELEGAELRRVCDPKAFGFRITDELSLPEPGTLIGQERARKAIERGLEIPANFHIYVFGPPRDVGRVTLVTQILERAATGKKTPNDLCAVFNFDEKSRPRMISLPAGQGREFAAEMAAFIRELPGLIFQLARGKEAIQIAAAVGQEVINEREQLEEELNKEVAPFGYVLVRTPQGAELGKMRKDVEDPDPETAKTLSIRFVVFLEEYQRIGQAGPRKGREGVAKLIKPAVAVRLESLKKYGPEVAHFAEKVVASVCENYEVLGKVRAEAHSSCETCGTEGQSCGVEAQSLLQQYRVNVLVDNAGISGAPVVFETNPTYHNLLGVIEYVPTSGGVYTTDHTCIQAGALHRANGGFLVLDIGALLKGLLGGYTYEALKTALRTKKLSLEPFGRETALFPAKSLSPEPVPLDVKVILLGEPEILAILEMIDPEFRDLFKVRAQFEIDMPRTPENEKHYVSFIRVREMQTGIPPFDRGAVAKVVEHGSRLAGDQEGISLRFGAIDELLQEASLVASQQGNSCVTAGDVRQALEDRIHRLNYIEERIRERLKEGTLLISTEGKTVGQVNGLVVHTVNDEYAFGLPGRITAQTGVGKEGVIDILREVEMGGQLHSKGVFILAGYLTGKYAQRRPLSASISLTFEQEYGGLEGDSASAAELFVILSALSEIPLRQDIAVTGSVNQHGEIQPIGGVNMKIEGFFDACRVKGALTGEQGVIIPATNVRHLMLREDVVEAVEKGQFHVWPMETVDEGLEILTGVPAGELRKDGTYPEGTVNRAVNDKLASYAKAIKEAGEEAGVLRRFWRKIW